jgi:Mg/Co/Ni transporter MgtE
MAKDDVATLLNDMAPDDRTLFLEELPAAATRELSRCSHLPSVPSR